MNKKTFPECLCECLSLDLVQTLSDKSLLSLSSPVHDYQFKAEICSKYEFGCKRQLMMSQGTADLLDTFVLTQPSQLPELKNKAWRRRLTSGVRLSLCSITQTMMEPEPRILRTESDRC